MTTVRGGNALFENDGHGHFKDITKEAGVDYVGHSSGAVFFDYDNDGLLDLSRATSAATRIDDKGRGGAYVGLPDAFSGHLYPDRSETAILYKNMGGNRFRDVTAGRRARRRRLERRRERRRSERRRLPGSLRLNMQGANHYFENQRRQEVRRQDRSSTFPRTPWGAMGIKFFDYDNDGRPDLFITDMHSDMSEEVGPGAREAEIAHGSGPTDFLQGDENEFIFGNALYHNLGGGKFEEISDRMGVENYWPWGPSVGDLNADGWQDVFIAASMNFRSATASTRCC